MRAHVVDDLAHAREQPGIVQHRLAHRDAVPTELAGFSDQPGGVGQCPHRNRSVIGRHAAELVAGHERCLGAQVCGAERGEHTRRSGANDDDVEHVHPLFYVSRSASQRRARSPGMKPYSPPRVTTNRGRP